MFQINYFRDVWIGLNSGNNGFRDGSALNATLLQNMPEHDLSDIDRHYCVRLSSGVLKSAKCTEKYPSICQLPETTSKYGEYSFKLWLFCNKIN